MFGVPSRFTPRPAWSPHTSISNKKKSHTQELLQRGGSGGIGKGASSSSEQQAAAAAAAGLLGTRKLDWNAFVAMLRIRTNMVLILQVGWIFGGGGYGPRVWSCEASAQTPKRSTTQWV